MTATLSLYTGAILLGAAMGGGSDVTMGAVSAAQGMAAQAQICTVGRNVDVLWIGTWYKAKIIEAKPDDLRVFLEILGVFACCRSHERENSP